MDARNRNISDEENTIASIFAQLDQHDLSSLLERDQSKQKQQIATNLVRQTRMLKHRTALNILMQATRHPLFTDNEAHQIIIAAIQKEKYHRSPINTDAKTLAFIKQHQLSHPEEIEEFLTSPERLLIWINQSSAVETANFIRYYFQYNTEYYIHIRNIAESECANHAPGKGYICYTLIRPCRLLDTDIEKMGNALQVLQNTELNKFQQIFKIGMVRMHATNELIRHADGCYLNLSHAQMIGMDLSNMRIAGANINHANLSDCNLSHTDLSGADLSGADLTNANLYFTYLKGANLADATITGTHFFAEESFTLLNTFKQHLDNLAVMLEDHRFYFKIQAAIMNDLIHHAYANKIPKNIMPQILEAAYEHPIFSKHSDHHLFKSATNAVSSTIFSWFQKIDDSIHDDIPLYESSAQKFLRSQILKLNATLIREQRPAPPNRPPPPPKIN